MITKTLNNVPWVDRTGSLPKTVFVNWRYTDSTNVDRVGWPVEGEPLMIVEFKNGSLYGYIGCPRQRAVALASARSVGRYLNEKIKPNYKAVKLS